MILDFLKNMFNKKSSSRTKRPSHLKKPKTKRLRGFGQHRVIARHQKRMKSPFWALPFARRERVPYSLSGE